MTETKETEDKKEICPVCGFKLMPAEKVVCKIEETEERYYFCPYCFGYSISRRKHDSIDRR